MLALSNSAGKNQASEATVSLSDKQLEELHMKMKNPGV